MTNEEISGIGRPGVDASRVGVLRTRPRTASSARVWVGLAAAVFLAAVRLAAGPPFFTDDPEPVDFRHGEFYLASMHSGGHWGWSGTAPHFEVNYGFAPNFMVHLIAALSFDLPRGGRLRYGLGDTELGFKYRFLSEAGGRPQVGIFPHVELPTGNSGRGLGSGQVQAFLPVWVQKSFGPWTTYGGGGYWINPGPGNRNYWWFGWEVQRDLSEAVTVGAEVFASTPSAVGAPAAAGFNLGTIIALRPGHFLLFSAGANFHGAAARFLYIAYQLTWGRG